MSATEAVPMAAALVAALSNSFRQVPPAAVPAMLDCVLASTGISPSFLFSSLLDAFPRANLGALKSFVWKILVPLLKLVHAHGWEIINETADSFFDVVTETNTWNYLEATMVPFLLRSVGLSMGMLQSEEMAIYGWNGCSLTDTYVSEGSMMSQSGSLPLHNSCHILSSMLDSATESQCAHGNPSKSSSAKETCEETLAKNLLWDICNMAVRMLLQSVEHRFCAIQILLPNILKAFVAHHAFKISVRGQTTYFFKKLWACCRKLFTLGPVERRDSYSLLSLYLTSFSCTDGHEADDVGDREERFDIREDNEFWEEMKKGLVDKEGLVRKQSLHILKEMLQISEGSLGYSGVSETASSRKSSMPDSLTKRGRWADKEAKSLGITLLLHSSFPCDDSLSGVLDQNHMEASTDIFVRCLIMESFLGIDWKIYGNCSELVPEAFVLGPFIQGLNDPVHHKDFGSKGIYSSRTMDGATKFMCQYGSNLYLRKGVAFLTNLASAAKKQSLGRAGLMGLAECIASAACGVKIHCENEVESSKCAPFDLMQVPSATPNSFHCSKADLLDVLRFIIESSKQHFNHNYRLRVCEKVLDAAASVVHIFDVSLEILLHFISAVPREFTDFGGSLRAKVRNWLCACDDKHCTSNCCCTLVKLLKSLCDFPRNFIGLHGSVSVSINYDDEELDAWELEAIRWARVVFLVIKEGHHLDPILTVIRTYGNDVCKQEIQLECVPVKYLILLLSLIQELQIMQQRVAETHKKGRTKLELDLLYKGELFSSAEICVIVEKFAQLCLSILEGLVSFATSSSSIFWSGVLEATNLPCSIKGKLGGPSQRRLPFSATTAVLQAIMSVKAVAVVSLWCVQSESDGLLNFAFNFLWNFFWKIVSSPTSDSEAEAEIQLAAYEALAHVLKAVVSGFSSLALNLIMENHISSSLNAEGKSVLDSLVLSFLQNINTLIAVEKLWICLEYLLSIPRHAFENGVHIQTSSWFFSDSTLRLVFRDLVDSLENAGEASTLPMLRSIRLVLELFNPGRMGSAVSSSDGIDVQMMWHLVRSSWMMHVSCNKRRVAPIAALLSCVLHYSVFDKECMHETNNSPGPLKWFIENILKEGTKSPRTIRLAALHLTGLWLLNPKSIKYYMKELKLLTLYGSVAFDEDFEAELAENHDVRREVSLLAKSPDLELTEAFINTELYARVSVAVLFYKLSDLAVMVGSKLEDSNCQAAMESGKMFLLDLLDFAVNDKDLAKELYKKYSGVHRRKVRAWQMLCILSPFVDKNIMLDVTCSLHVALYRNNLPAVRQYLETVAINIYMKFPSLAREQLVPIFQDYDTRPQASIALSSYVFIAANVILHASATVQSSHLVELLPPIIPLLTSHHHSLRGFSQLLVYQVLNKLLPPLDSNSHEIVTLERRCFEDLKRYLAKNSDCARINFQYSLRASMEGYLDAFNPKESVTPAGIFSSRVEVVQDVREDLRYSMAKDAETINNECLRINEDPLSVKTSVNADKEKLPAMLPKDLPLDFQKKVTISKHGRQDTDSEILLGKNDTSKPLREMEKEDQLLDDSLHSRSLAVEKIRGNRQHFILVASLLDRIPNLAGLARTCEVFKAAGLAIADANVVDDKQFQLIRLESLSSVDIFADLFDLLDQTLDCIANPMRSPISRGLYTCWATYLTKHGVVGVTAEKWVPIIEVPVSNLKVFLHKKKREGFSILGLEQTANSIPLDQYDFPKKMLHLYYVLVLGREKEGIPVEIIHILDACIEIPQLGVVRSLNVHVSGAIALWEYTRQQRSV
ncbi:hypothetical protein RHGRI_030659 [Rhododendron griersonianum]|uniref:tRNA/rRNA methyltransferase SpoU type domain-containing protein n=1 Tax=Rhododendron griersonianum TaxID=479676 RepID=A0AAV6I4Y7_9ERIC|nr:hypothetical protein RHGRI_030659 [Rhododendron griersonianum]